MYFPSLRSSHKGKVGLLLKEQFHYLLEQIIYYISCLHHHQGPVVQSMVSLMSSLRGQLVKYFTTLLLNTLIFFVEKMREAFALQKLLTLFQQKILANI